MGHGAKTLEALMRLGIEPARIAARGLEEFQEAQTLELAEIGRDGRRHMLIPPAARAWRELRDAARAEGIEIYIVSAFRTIERQVELIERKLAAGQALDEILTVVAPPGFSEHHTARAVDVGSPGALPLDEDFDRTPAFHWLRERAVDHGFVLSYPEGNSAGYCYEPWHWCWHGKPGASPEDADTGQRHQR